jgi:uncharacterized membrane protein
MQIALVAAAISAGVSSGTTFAFSTFVMRALGELSVPDAVRAMQSINVFAINPPFLAVLIGTGLFAAVLSVMDVAGAGLGANRWLMAGAVVYVVGVVGVTNGGNVPLNDALAVLDPASLPADAWTAYARPWTWFNHLRTLAAAVASGLFIVAAMQA